MIIIPHINARIVSLQPENLMIQQNKSKPNMKSVICNLKIRSRFALVALLAFVASSAAAADLEVTAPTNIFTRNTISLNGDWHYIVDPQEIGYYDYRMRPTRWGFFVNAEPKSKSDLVEYSFAKAETMKVPSTWNKSDERLFFYEGTVWYERDFQYEKRDGERTLLYFGAVSNDARVWLNGKELGHHIGGFTPFCYDVSDVIADGNNFVVVKVDNKRAKENIPTNIFDWWNYGGIIRDVMLVRTPNNYIEDYVVQLDGQNQRLLNCFVRLKQPQEGVKVTLEIPELKIKKSLFTNSNGTARVQIKARPRLWSPENPVLYKVKLQANGETLSDEIGFRTIATRGHEILLNGKPVFLRGIAMHDEAPFKQGRVTTTEEAHTLLNWAKELGCNYVRLAHYPHNELTVREAERMGLMVWEEIPVYWTIDWTNNATLENAKRQLHDMILRDHSRANVVIWSIANETPHSVERDLFLSSLAKYARTQDSTRLISMAMEVTGAKNFVNRLNDNMHEFVDIVAFNQYVGWYRDVKTARKMTWEITYNKPVIISEFGGGAVYGRHGDAEERWTEEFQERLYEENLAMIDRINGVAGTSPWVLMDFMSPRRPLKGVQDWFNRKGLFSPQGQKKKAFYVVQDWYKKKKSADEQPKKK